MRLRQGTNLAKVPQRLLDPVSPRLELLIHRKVATHAQRSFGVTPLVLCIRCHACALDGNPAADVAPQHLSHSLRHLSVYHKGYFQPAICFAHSAPGKKGGLPK